MAKEDLVYGVIWAATIAGVYFGAPYIGKIFNASMEASNRAVDAQVRKDYSEVLGPQFLTDRKLMESKYSASGHVSDRFSAAASRVVQSFVDDNLQNYLYTNVGSDRGGALHATNFVFTPQELDNFVWTKMRDMGIQVPQGKGISGELHFELVESGPHCPRQSRANLVIDVSGIVGGKDKHTATVGSAVVCNQHLRAG